MLCFENPDPPLELMQFSHDVQLTQTWMIMFSPFSHSKFKTKRRMCYRAKADEALKAKERSEEEAKKRKEEDQATLVEQVKRAKEIEAIESDSFVPQTFRSSKEVKKSAEPTELQYEPVTIGVGTVDTSAPEKEQPSASIPTAIKYQDDNSLAHPNPNALPKEALKPSGFAPIIRKTINAMMPRLEDPFAAHHEYMRQMMRSFSDPFGRDPFLSVTDGEERTVDRRARQDSQVALRGNRRDADFGEPFFAMDRMMSNMRNSMLEMQRKFDDLSIHPDAHTFSSSSVMTYSKVGDEPPKVFQASSQTRTAPGGVKETRKALKDSESGLEKMAIGHHINDRAHVIRKSKNSKTGDEEMNQEFINLDEISISVPYYSNLLTTERSLKLQILGKIIQFQ
ncbi:hypothetical protein AAES_94802 [Amazona aestiva]|uniref:Myeloid leukemia factor 1 n=1 Tax=Amazona aestiva TaxID=12930 RepID=A0A0Q3TIV1_AMAAE|nr:hypothetical protein AAES_94802 [Amazona aestiva]